MIRQVQSLCMTYLAKANKSSNRVNIVTQMKILEILKYITYPRDMSTPSISTTCPAESSTSFKASSSLQVTAKPSPAMSKSARGYKDFKIPRIRLTDCLILARIIS
jgi:hypothetical protein